MSAGSRLGTMHRNLFLASLFFSLIAMVALWGGRAEACTSISSATTISTAGCYTVTANFSASASAITVSVSDVTINLSGHTITGGTGSGINGASTSFVVVNGPGIIMSFGGAGITLGASAIVQHVTAVSNTGVGINVGDNSVVTDCTTESNGGSGIACGGGCSLTDNVADSNSGSGLSLGIDGGVVNNTMQGNGQYGLNNTGLNTGFGENVMYNNSSGCSYSTGGSMSNNVCSGTVF